MSADAPVGFLAAAASRCVVFFFSSRRRHTRLVSDWSSDVCSSDLILARPGHGPADDLAHGEDVHAVDLLRADRSEERRVGKECRSRWSPDHQKKKKTKAIRSSNVRQQEAARTKHEAHDRISSQTKT